MHSQRKLSLRDDEFNRPLVFNAQQYASADKQATFDNRLNRGGQPERRDDVMLISGELDDDGQESKLITKFESGKNLDDGEVNLRVSLHEHQD